MYLKNYYSTFSEVIERFPFRLMTIRPIITSRCLSPIQTHNIQHFVFIESPFH